MITPSLVTAILARVREQHGGRPCLELDYNDRRVAWQSFIDVGDGGYPGLAQGQDRDSRWSITDGSGLHGHWFSRRRVLRLHIDSVDPRRDPVGHVVADTHVPAWTGLGAVAGLVLFEFALPALLFGAAVGALVGANANHGPTSVWRVSFVGWGGDWRAERVDRQAFT
jgi:hypothetical protein